VETTVRTPRPEKVAVVDEVRERLGSSAAAILTEYRGLAVKDMEELRRSLTKVGGEYKVYKNTLVRRAANEVGLGGIESMLEGPTAIAFVDGDVAQVAKVLRDFSRTNPNLVVKGGLLGQNLLDANRTNALADLPSREVLLAQIAGLLAAPLQRFAGLLQAVPSKMAYALSALLEERKKNAPAEAVASAAEPAEPEPVAEESAPTEAVTETAAEAPAEEAEVAVTEEPVAEAAAETTAEANDDAPAAEAAAESDASGDDASA
jgi:large subunit ribosomal protein L10